MKLSHCVPRKFYPSNQFVVKFFSKTLISRIYCEKIMDGIKIL